MISFIQFSLLAYRINKLYISSSHTATSSAIHKTRSHNPTMTPAAPPQEHQSISFKQEFSHRDATWGSQRPEEAPILIQFRTGLSGRRSSHVDKGVAVLFVPMNITFVDFRDKCIELMERNTYKAHPKRGNQLDCAGFSV